MNLPTEIFGNVAVMHSPDELTADQADAFVATLSRQERGNIVLDLDGTEALDSAGLTAILDVVDRLRADGGDLKISTGNAVNRKILEITRLDEQLEVFDSVIDAVKAFR